MEEQKKQFDHGVLPKMCMNGKLKTQFPSPMQQLLTAYEMETEDHFSTKQTDEKGIYVCLGLQDSYSNVGKVNSYQVVINLLEDQEHLIPMISLSYQILFD